MTRIGYIYRYNENEGKGILVYGYNWDTWKDKTCPIKFTNEDCISEVNTGQLVYFDYEDKSAKNIERVSLSNFRRDVILELVELFKEDNNWIEGKKATTIRFENLADIKVEKPKEKVQDIKENSNAIGRRRGLLKIPNIPPILNIDDDDDIFDDWDDDKDMVPIEIPNSIDDLFSLFGKHSHNNGSSYSWHIHSTSSSNASIEIDILDLKYWIDEVNRPNEYYGMSVAQIADLYDLFVQRKVNSYNYEQWRYPNKTYMSFLVSPEWKILLADKTEADLRAVCKEVPMLQPALPRKFCMENLDVLTIDYGFPSISICESLYRFRIGITKTTLEYNLLKENISDAILCKKEHNKNEGVKPCKLKKKVLRELITLLDNQYQTEVLGGLKQKIYLLSNNKIAGDKKIQKHLENKENNYLLKLGEFIDLYDNVINECDYSAIHYFAKAYSELSDDDKEAFKVSMVRKSEECVIKIAKSNYTEGKAELLQDTFRILSDFINSEFTNVVRELVNIEFSHLDNLKEIEFAYNSQMISEKQYLSRYKELTKEYSVQRFIDIVSNYESKDLPLSIQEYIINTIFNRLNLKDLCTYRIGDHLYNLEDVIEKLKYQSSCGYIDAEIFNIEVLEATKNLSKEDRWYLFEKNLIPSPSYDNIREKLNEAYQQNKIENKYFKQECFQSVLADDAIKGTDYNRLFLILQVLNNKYKTLVNLNGNPTLRFFVWSSEPTGGIDWNLMKENFHLLPDNVQIRVFKYLFYLKNKGEVDFTIPKLYEELTGNGTYDISKELLTILFLLEKKAKSLTDSISNNEIRKVSGNEEIIDNSNNPFGSLFTSSPYLLKWNFSKLKDFFFECYGYLLLSWKESDLDYFSYNGRIDTVNTNKGLFYSISFYESPVDFYGRYVDYLDDERILRAKNVLERNIPYEIVDGSYWISAQYEIDVREFVVEFGIEDCCNLFNDQSGLPLHTNYNVQYEKSSMKFCKCSKNCRGVDSAHRISFCWCNKQPCTRRGKFFAAIDDWENYKFIDLLNILYQGDSSVRNLIWDADAEISQFLNDFIANPKIETDSHPVLKENEVGEWTKDMYIVSDISPDDEEEFGEEIENYDDSDYREKPTYDKYSGSYAQDVEGWSDQDIDDVLDGEPDAYWNID